MGHRSINKVKRPTRRRLQRAIAHPQRMLNQRTQPLRPIARPLLRWHALLVARLSVSPTTSAWLCPLHWVSFAFKVPSGIGSAHARSARDGDNNVRHLVNFQCFGTG